MFVVDISKKNKTNFNQIVLKLNSSLQTKLFVIPALPLFSNGTHEKIVILVYRTTLHAKTWQRNENKLQKQFRSSV